MEMTGEQRVPASQAEVWAALNDPEVLKGCVPGCESIERLTDTEYRVLMTARVGPVAAKFKGKMTLSDAKPPHAYALSFEGQGGVAGFAKGSASVELTPQGQAETLLRYQAKAHVGGKLAQVGSRLVDAAAQKVASDFFTAFNERMSAMHAAAAHVAEHAADEHPHPAPVPRDPDLPNVDDASLAFFAAGVIVVFFVALAVFL